MRICKSQARATVWAVVVSSHSCSPAALSAAALAHTYRILFLQQADPPTIPVRGPGPLTASTMLVALLALLELTSRTFMLPSDTSRREVPTTQNRSCRLRGGWRLSGNESSATSTRSNNISEVGLPLLYSVFPFCLFFLSFFSLVCFSSRGQCLNLEMCWPRVLHAALCMLPNLVVRNVFYLDAPLWLRFFGN